MSEPIPESIPTSADPRSRRPTKKRALTPQSAQASQVEALFAKPDRDIHIPSTGALSKNSSLPPEIVANVQGSSAGAGSGEFHVYKASRRREYERLRLMDEEVQKEEDAKQAKKGGKREAGSETDGTPAAEEETTKKKLTPNSNAPKTGQDGDAQHDANDQGGQVQNVDEIGLIIEDDD
ncbi:repeatdomain protein [Pyrenophora tritici-repentis]|uniref:DUF1168 multi-domain protein n=1 Tax=Pyrenophora tritici-repentis TaxID=45151 RepID=A0A2W1H3G4_9PLEO|nr:DUF1168 domain protein [Pyrenophora tritici-repentis]KAF7454448.1 DUF1168 domain protein [Pyrenophora tritici-repentis]KAF7577566.1 DUF1168 multi-domain protein [Pyrenophora tritici-repentis]KAI0587050.1 DUF1168 domain protein [Pyrenophora tritici-repentis]KAI1538520.1 repeatdomain protein [Pyrenophora tritici-repentis]